MRENSNLKQKGKGGKKRASLAHLPGEKVPRYLPVEGIDYWLAVPMNEKGEGRGRNP